ncbi:pseudouridine synthase [Gymnopilus junonius]|uniref:Pseudouridine synthase n=1 Tax=Gymnopilus junonius TaxID=109634 RepID=A0A9P5TP66_GYMJU|nr:pseudouridine synthase [Gymnopilus junonius]
MNITFRTFCTRSSISRLGYSMPATSTSSPSPGPYAGWTRERLVERLMQLEGTGQPSATLPGPLIQDKAFDFSKHSKRKIALKFCYSGWEYGGLAYQLGPTPLPTVENVLFDVLAKTRLVDPEAGFDGCGWEKCGRTDRGVSAAGQVVSLWVRSAFPWEDDELHRVQEDVEKAAEAEKTEDDGLSGIDDGFGSLGLSDEPSSNTSIRKAVIQEHDYLAMMNRLLPATIRVIAWSPVPTSFSARFSCKYRHYKYFFSSMHLDIPAMQAAASRLVGEHDFRNLCKLDAQKQITSFRRKITRATVEPLEGEEGGNGEMHVFDLIGSAFLYHQVRHVMAMLFLVGSGLEPPSIVTELMNVEDGVEPLRPEDVASGKEKYTVVDRKPEYQMADALPLMLWECGYDESELNWRTSGGPDETGGEIVRGDLYHQLQSIHTRSRVFSTLDRAFHDSSGKTSSSTSVVIPSEKWIEGSGCLERSTGEGEIYEYSPGWRNVQEEFKIRTYVGEKEAGHGGGDERALEAWKGHEKGRKTESGAGRRWQRMSFFVILTAHGKPYRLYNFCKI